MFCFKWSTVGTEIMYAQVLALIKIKPSKWLKKKKLHRFLDYFILCLLIKIHILHLVMAADVKPALN